MRVEDTLGLACKALGARSGPDNARPLYLPLNFILEIFYLARGILRGMTEPSLQFHIEANDYFGTLATVLDLVSQDLRKKGHHNNAESELNSNPAAPILLVLQDEFAFDEP